MKNVVPKPRIALLAMNIMGGGSAGNGIPVLFDLFERLSRHYDITFYSFQSTEAGSVPPLIKLKPVTKLRIPGRLKYFLLLIRIIVDHIGNPFQLFFSVSVYPPGRAAILLSKILGTPSLVQLIALEAVALPDINAGNLTIPWLAKITRTVCGQADYLVAVAQYQADIAKIELPSIRRIDVLPLRIDHTKFTFKERRITAPVQFIHIAYYSPIKDQDMMFRTFERISRVVECRLTVIGDGFKSPKIRKMLQELEIEDRISFLGPQSYHDIPRYLGDSHILLHTARFETGCAVIQEAMASGVAVAGTRVGILSDIGEKYAVVVPPGNFEELAEKTILLIQDAQLYSQKTKDAFEWIRNFDAVWAAESYKLFIDLRLKVRQARVPL